MSALLARRAMLIRKSWKLEIKAWFISYQSNEHTQEMKLSCPVLDRNLILLLS
jgi:hypothetical protein